MTLRRSAVTLVVLGGLLALVGAAGATGGVKVVRVSHCPGPPNAEVVQAVDGRYVYEAWIGCKRSIGFARSVDGGQRFGRSRSVPGSAQRRVHSWDPAIAVAPDGTVYVAYMVASRVHTSRGSVHEMRPAVAISHDLGRSFDRVSQLPIPLPSTRRGNWGDREFLTVGPDGTVYVTWDYGPRADQVKVVCPPSSSCYFGGGDFNAVIQRSTDGGKTWTKVSPITPGFPLGGIYSAPIVAERDGALDVLYWQNRTNPRTLRVSPGHEYFVRSTDGGKTWSHPVPIGPRAGMIGLKEWWIDGSLAVDSAGTLYASWDTQSRSGDTAWLAWSTNGGRRWSSPLRVASSRSEHLTEVAAAGPRDVYVGWQTVVHGKGYATFLRRLAVGTAWTGPAERVSAYGNPKVWPGDTFGLSTQHGAALLSWGSAAKGRRASEIYFAAVELPSP